MPFKSLGAVCYSPSIVAAAAAPHYFRFRSWWCYFHTVKIYPQTKFRRGTMYLNPRLRYNYFRSGKTNVRHIAVICVLFWMKFPNFVQIWPPAAMVWPLFAFQDGSRGGSILLPVSYLMIRRLSANQISSTYLIHGWDITTSVLEEQLSAILKFYFRFRFWPYHRTRHVTLH